MQENWLVNAVLLFTPWLITGSIYRAASNSPFQLNVWKKLVSGYSQAMYH